MGGKNPAIVARSADLEEAAEGIMRSAFGFGGQKCSANSRVYVERPVHDELVRLLVEKTEKITIGNPIPRENWLGPIIDQKAVDRHQQAVAEARRDGTVFTGGEHLTDGDMARGFYVEPTVVGLPASHRLFQDELFAPFTAVQPVDSLDEALRLANDSIYGLTAGVYSEDPAEVARFLDEVHAGRAVREPARRRDDRRVAGRPGVRWLEGLRLDRQGRPVGVLRRPVPARAEPHGRRLRAASRGSPRRSGSPRAGWRCAPTEPGPDVPAADGLPRPPMLGDWLGRERWVARHRAPRPPGPPDCSPLERRSREPDRPRARSTPADASRYQWSSGATVGLLAGGGGLRRQARVAGARSQSQRHLASPSSEPFATAVAQAGPPRRHVRWPRPLRTWPSRPAGELSARA